MVQDKNLRRSWFEVFIADAVSDPCSGKVNVLTVKIVLRLQSRQCKVHKCHTYLIVKALAVTDVLYSVCVYDMKSLPHNRVKYKTRNPTSLSFNQFLNVTVVFFSKKLQLYTRMENH